MALLHSPFRGKALHRTTLGATAIASVLLADAAYSQPPLPSEADLSANTAEHIAMFSLNAFLGGVIAGIFRLAGGDPVEQALTDGFLRGAAGGALSYAGKRVAVSDFDGAGFLGREIAALGASTTANASDGIGTFDRLILPLGPLPGRLIITKNGSRHSARPVVDLLSAAAVLYGLAASKYSIDWNASLSGGVAVFREREPQLDARGSYDVERESYYQGNGYRAGATSVAGTAFVSYLAPEDDVLAHERVHTIQFDYVTTTLSDPADTWMMERALSVDRWLKLNLIPVVFGAINQSLEPLANHDKFPWEQEAILLTGRR